MQSHATQKQIKYYDFIPFLDFQYEKIIFNCQPSHFSPCSAVPGILKFNWSSMVTPNNLRLPEDSMEGLDGVN